MKKSRIYTAWALVIGFSLMSVTCHEIIPAPVDYGDPVALDCEFTGQIMGSTDTTMIQMNDGSITCTSSSVKNVVSNGGISDAQYISTITSSNTGEVLTFRIGQVEWQGGNAPDSTTFVSFFGSDSTRMFDNTHSAGLSLIYRDASGTFWTSQDTITTVVPSFRFTNLAVDQDTTGIYQLYEALTTTVLYNGAGTDSLVLTGGFVKGHFKYE